MKRSEILANREKWIAFLEVPSRRKTIGSLDNGDGKRCCLGHACYILDIPKKVDASIYYDGETDLAPSSLIEKVGLWHNDGATENNEDNFIINGIEFSSLAEANDGLNSFLEVKKGQSPQNIAKYLRSVIEGGENTPFKPLSDYTND